MHIMMTSSKDESICYRSGDAWTEAAHISEWIVPNSGKALADSTCWVVLVSIYTGRSSRVLQKNRRQPPRSARRSTGAGSVGRWTRLPPHQHTQSREKEEKRKFCPYRKGTADRGGERFTLATQCFLFHSVRVLLYGGDVPGFRIFLQEF